MDYKNITRMIDRIDQLQEAHINAFDHDLLPDLETQCQERSLAIEQLKQKIDEVAKTVTSLPTQEADEGMRFFITRISALVKQNRVLEKKVRTHKEGLEKSMKKIAAGKKIIHSYASPVMTLNRPRVISHTE